MKLVSINKAKKHLSLMKTPEKVISKKVKATKVMKLDEIIVIEPTQLDDQTANESCGIELSLRDLTFDDFEDSNQYKSKSSLSLSARKKLNRKFRKDKMKSRNKMIVVDERGKMIESDTTIVTASSTIDEDNIAASSELVENKSTVSILKKKGSYPANNMTKTGSTLSNLTQSKDPTKMTKSKSTLSTFSKSKGPTKYLLKSKSSLSHLSRARGKFSPLAKMRSNISHLVANSENNESLSNNNNIRRLEFTISVDSIGGICCLNLDTNRNTDEDETPEVVISYFKNCEKTGKMRRYDISSLPLVETYSAHQNKGMYHAKFQDEDYIGKKPSFSVSVDMVLNLRNKSGFEEKDFFLQVSLLKGNEIIKLGNAILPLHGNESGFKRLIPLGDIKFITSKTGNKASTSQAAKTITKGLESISFASDPTRKYALERSFLLISSIQARPVSIRDDELSTMIIFPTTIPESVSNLSDSEDHIKTKKDKGLTHTDTSDYSASMLELLNLETNSTQQDVSSSKDHKGDGDSTIIPQIKSRGTTDDEEEYEDFVGRAFDIIEASSEETKSYIGSEYSTDYTSGDSGLNNIDEDEESIDGSSMNGSSLGAGSTFDKSSFFTNYRSDAERSDAERSDADNSSYSSGAEISSCKSDKRRDHCKSDTEDYLFDDSSIGSVSDDESVE